MNSDPVASASSKLSALTDQLQTSTYAVIATSTCKASYTGLLKEFLDRCDAGGLHGVTAILAEWVEKQAGYLPEVKART